MEQLNAIFNSVIDVSLVVATRLGELPFVFVTALVFLGVSLTFAVKLALQRLRGRPQMLGHRFARALGVTLVIGLLVHMTQRIDLLLRESRELQYFARKNAVAEAAGSAAGSTALRLIDVPALEHELDDLLGRVDLSVSALADGVELATFHSLGANKVSGYASVVDLARRGLSIEITEEFGEKSLTSEFAMQHECIVAVNGEAGTSPAQDASLGSYVGCWMVDGEAHSLGPGNWRPFLGFDVHNRGTYYRAQAGGAAPSVDTWNSLWGRGDLLVGGEFVPGATRRWSQPNPRTLMGLDEGGTRLFMIVVDGRQWGYSVGLDLESCARLMRAFGAHDAMWCDQGGSSTMFAGRGLGVINRPSDGKERPVYTHFGVSLH